VLWSGLTALFAGGLFVLSLLWHYWLAAAFVGLLTVGNLSLLVVQLQIRSSRRRSLWRHS
jgi:membrane protein implicated in regulation of membrane protease activity